MANNIPSKLRQYMKLDNIVPELDDELLVRIGSSVVDGAEEDEDSRAEWKEEMEESLKIAKQVIERKTTPWQGAANVKYPLILSSCIQFNARTNPEIVQGDKVVQVSVMRPDPQGEEEDRARRLSSHMSYQLLGQSDNWRNDTDKLLMILPLVGMVFRKSYYNSMLKKPQVDLCIPQDIIINNYVDSLETAQRITHILHLSNNDLIERMRSGLFKKYDMDDLMVGDDEGDTSNDFSIEKQTTDQKYDDNVLSSYIHTVYEQHRYLDLDDDGYQEPYVVTVHKGTEKVLRIVARYDEDSFVFNDNSKEFIKIIPIQYFTDYPFLPSPDGTYYAMGFGKILYPINETVNTILNQLLDAGTLANIQGGWISSEVRMRPEDLRFKPGEFKEIKLRPGSELGKSIFPLPFKEASSTLFSLLELMIKTGEELSSVSTVMQGQPPGANTPATTVMALIEQGTKVFSAMLYRLYNSFKKEFEKLYEINRKYLDQYETFKYASLTGMVTLEDYRSPDYGIFPVADPTMSSDAQRLARAQALMQVMNEPGVDKQEVLTRWLDALQVPNPKKILPPPDPNASPPIQEQLAEAELQLKKMQPADLLMQRELQAIELSIREKEMMSKAALYGSQVTDSKVDAIAKIAELEQVVPEKDVSKAVTEEEQLSGLVSKSTKEEEAPFDQKIAQLEDVLGNMLGQYGPPSQVAQPLQSPPGATPGAGGPPGEEGEAQPIQEQVPVVSGPAGGGE